MSAQTSYNFFTKEGQAGGIFDLAPYEIDTFLNAEDTGVMEFGIGVVQGDKPGVNVIKPTASATSFEGITVNNRTTEYDMEGAISIKNAAAVGVMRYGKIYAKVEASPSTAIAYGDAAYLIKSGDDAGKFTNSSTDTVAVKGVFRSAASNGVAVIELFNEAQ